MDMKILLNVFLSLSLAMERVDGRQWNNSTLIELTKGSIFFSFSSNFLNLHWKGNKKHTQLHFEKNCEKMLEFLQTK